MRARLLRSTLAIALLALVTLGVPLLVLARHAVWSQDRAALHEQAANVAAGLEDRLDAGEPVSLTRYAEAIPGRELMLTHANGSVQLAGPALTGRVLSAQAGVSGSTVTVRAASGATSARALRASLLVLGLAALATGAAVALTLRQAHQLAAPLGELTARADALGRHDFTPAPVRSGIPEIDGISRVLEASARQLATRIEVQQDFASDAAHQLRTPLTGIGLRLEELIRTGDADARSEATAALEQVERLDAVISSLLARAHGDVSDPRPHDLAALLRDELGGWTEMLRTQGRSLTLSAPDPLPVLVRKTHIAAVLACLLDNAVRHGGGAVSVTARSVAGDAVVSVRDTGDGVPSGLVPFIFERRISGGAGSGIGLALARSLIGAEGGTLALSRACPSEFVLTLPLSARASLNERTSEPGMLSP